MSHSKFCIFWIKYIKILTLYVALKSCYIIVRELEIHCTSYLQTHQALASLRLIYTTEKMTTNLNEMQK